MKKTIIFDGSNLLHRCYWVHSVRRNVKVSQLFLASMKKCTNMFAADQVVCVWDARKRYPEQNYRHITSNGAYKQTRDKDKNAKVYSFCDEVQEISEPLGVAHLNPGILEADDFIYWLCNNIDDYKTVVSSDGDLLQLIGDTCDVYNPIVNKLITKETFEETTGMPDIRSYIVHKSLVGDKSDNIAGLEGVGPKRAKQIMERGIEKLSKENKELLEHNINLIDLSIGNIRHPEEWDWYEEEWGNKKQPPRDFSKFKQLCIESELFAITNKLAEWKSVFDKTQSIENIVAKLIKINEGALSNLND